MPEYTRRDALRTAGALGAAGLTGVGGAVGGAAAQNGDGRVETFSASLHRPGSSGAASSGFEGETVRQVAHTSVAGSEVKLRFGNPYGERAFVLSRVTVGVRADGAAVRPGSLTEVTFDGSTSVTIPFREHVTSDAVDLSLDADQDVVVNTYFEGPTGGASWHGGARDEAYIAAGDETANEGGGSFAELGNGYFFLEGISVVPETPTDGTVVCLGDSITNGARSEVGANNTYPDHLARRVNDADVVQKAVVNAGIDGNRLLHDSPDGYTFGTRVLDRFDHDVLAVEGVTDVLVLIGVNDIIHSEAEFLAPDQPVSGEEIIAGLEEIATRADDAGIRAICGTITPFGQYQLWSEETEEKRTTVNEWIRSTDVFDATVDFAAAVADPDYRSVLYPAYASDDGLHPNDSGYEVMAEAVELPKLTESFAPTTTTTATPTTAQPTSTTAPSTTTAEATTTAGDGGSDSTGGSDGGDGGGGGTIPGFGLPAAVAGLGAGAAALSRRARSDDGHGDDD